MIHITIQRTDSNRIKAFTISGHANFAKKGEDLVCAGVSAVSFGAVNAIISLTGIEPSIEQGKDGFLRCIIPEKLPNDVDEKVQILLEGMIVSLQTIERDYKKYVNIKLTS